MKVLIGCEESGVVREAFRARGHDAWSNDIEPARDDSKYHIQCDVAAAILTRWWDLIILHPPCDYLAVCGNKHYASGKPGYHKRKGAIWWTLNIVRLATANARAVVVENPASVIFPRLQGDYQVQYIQPHQFGHREFKKTGLALYGVDPLRPTNQLEVPMVGSDEFKEWEKVFRMAPSDTRKRDRSRTYDGIAQAMADQWGGDLLAEEKAIEIVAGIN